MENGANNEGDSLVTKTSAALATAPPRAPPHDSAHRMLLLAQDPSEAAFAHHHTAITHDDNHPHHGMRKHAMKLLRRYHLNSVRLPHPHLPAGPELGDQITRAIGVVLPISWQNRCRDSGGFRSISDGIVTASAPALALANPSSALKFLKLTNNCTRIHYGAHQMHVVDVFFPNVGGRDGKEPRGLIFFVHGGAWGSGLPWLYRLVAIPFLEMKFAVAIVGYRTYPDANVDGQVNDLKRAACELARRFPDICSKPKNMEENPSYVGNCLMGHSSGAHIAFLMLVDRVKQKVEEARHSTEAKSNDNSTTLEFDSFVGISGPYDICHHFDYEAGRGVEEISPMKPACGFTRDEFHRNSPALRLRQLLTTFSECEELCADNFLPRILLVHGVEDGTVPFTATAEAARIVRSCGVAKCDEIYLAQTGHQDAVMHFMLGGKTREAICSWLVRPADISTSSPFIHSKL